MNIEDQLKRLSKENRGENTRTGNNFRIYEKKYPFPLTMGKYTLHTTFTLEEITKITLPESAIIDVKEILFFDTETTGLSGGAGTIPFLVGFGYFTDTDFTTKQFFLESPSSEHTMLEEINDIISRYNYIASYNGKGFDTHILETRFILNRMQSELTDTSHIDLLYPCRAFLRRYLGSASLQDVERGILNYTRSDDIPGALIPYVYFDFLKNGNEEKINAVIEHNRFDILSLAFIIKLLDDLMGNPAESPHDLISLSAANYLKNKHIPQEAKAHFENLIRSGNNDTLRKEAKKNLSMLLKREDINKASVLWEEEKDELYAVVELAKYHEHRTKQIDMALKITNEGLNKCRLMMELGNDNSRYFYDDLKKRKRRLLRKIKRQTKA
ncbi:MAG: hypothetical protein GWP03_04440 [Proteobacteria bacterium]|nr:hypothetical protein [Pseudomonadota bacterium]